MDAVSFPVAYWSLTPVSFKDVERCVVGSLEFDGASPLVLEVYNGALLDWSWEQRGDEYYLEAGSLESLRTDQVYGYSQQGDYYVLRDVSTTGMNVPHPGFKRETLHASSLISSRAPIEANPIVSALYIKLPGLREWAGVWLGGQRIELDKNRKLKSTEFRFDADDLKSFTLFEDGNVCVSLEIEAVKRGGRSADYKFEFEIDCGLRLKMSETGCRLDEARDDWLLPTIEFLSFCMGFKPSISEMRFLTVEGIWGRCYAPFLGRRDGPSHWQLEHMPLPYLEIEKNVRGMIAKWYAFDGYARNASRPLVSLMDNWEMPLDMVFLTAAQAFEAVSRVGVDDQEISDARLEEKLQKIKHSNLSRRMKDWACYKLKDAKWKTANRLADDLLSNMEAVTTRLVPDLGRYKTDHRRHRDSITHGRSLEEDEQLSNEELYWHTGAVKVLTYAAIAQLLGITNEEFIDRMKASGYFSSEFVHAAKMYEVKPHENDDNKSKGTDDMATELNPIENIG